MPSYAGDRDERHRPERDRELHHPGEADEPAPRAGRVAPRRGHREQPPRGRAGTRAAPPCAGWRTYAPPSASCAIRPTGTTRRPRASSRANGSPAAISARVGRRFERLVAGMGRHDVPEQHVVRERRARRARAWTTVAVASAGPLPVSCRSEVSGIPDTRVPRYPGASATSRTAAPGRARRGRRRAARAGARRARRPGRS